MGTHSTFVPCVPGPREMTLSFLTHNRLGVSVRRAVDGALVVVGSVTTDEIGFPQRIDDRCVQWGIGAATRAGYLVTGARSTRGRTYLIGPDFIPRLFVDVGGDDGDGYTCSLRSPVGMVTSVKATSELGGVFQCAAVARSIGHDVIGHQPPDDDGDSWALVEPHPELPSLAPSRGMAVGTCLWSFATGVALFGVEDVVGRLVADVVTLASIVALLTTLAVSWSRSKARHRAQLDRWLRAEDVLGDPEDGTVRE